MPTVPLPDSTTGMQPVSSSYFGPGLRVRLSRVRGQTARGILTRPLYLPVTLGTFSVDETFTHNDFETSTAGEFSAPAPGKSLRTTDLETLTIDWYRYARWLVNPRVSPRRVRTQLLRLARSKTPFELLAILPRMDGQEELRMKATIRSIGRELRPGEADTRYYTIEIKEWRDMRVGRRRAGSSGRLPMTHRLAARDTLASLAKRYYSSPVSIPEGARAIRRANGIGTWGLHTPLVRHKRFRAGDKVKIPVPVETERNLAASYDAQARAEAQGNRELQGG